MAPYNTTQFLLDDREKRIKRDSDSDSVSGSLRTDIVHTGRSPVQDRYVRKVLRVLGPHWEIVKDSAVYPRGSRKKSMCCIF